MMRGAAGPALQASLPAPARPSPRPPASRAPILENLTPDVATPETTSPEAFTDLTQAPERAEPESVPSVPDIPTAAADPVAAFDETASASIETEAATEETETAPGQAIEAGRGGDVPVALGGAEADAASAATAAPSADGRETSEQAGATADGGAAQEQVAAEPSPEQAVAPAVAAVGRRAAGAASHQPAAAAAGGAIAASNDPAVTQRRMAEGAGIAGADDAETGEVDQNSFEAALRQAIADAMPEPRDEEHAREVMEQGGQQAAAAVGQTMGEQQTQAVGNLPAAVEEGAQPDPTSMNGGEAVALAPEDVGAPPEGVSAAPVVPPPSTDAAIDTSENRERVDTLAAENNITNEQLAEGNEPEFQAALGAREQAEAHDQEAPERLREAEAQDRQGTREQAEGAVAGGLAVFHGERAERLNAVAGRQTTTQGVTEARKHQITADIEAIGASVRADVTAILDAMDTEVNTTFETAINEALAAYDDAFEDVKGGIGTSISDFFRGRSSDERLDMAFAAGRRVFDARISRGITEVAGIVERKLAAARARVTEGRAEIERYMTEEISSAEREFAEEAGAAITADFDALEGEIDSRRDSLVERMVGMYRDGMERRSAREEQLREENKSFWDRVYDATVGVIQKVIEFKNMLLGILARAAAVVEAIIQDPIGFLRNLIAGIRAGLDAFVGNIVEHLKQGLMGWLFGALQGAGIEIPERFDLKGILSLVFQVLGLTYANIRSRAVRLLGEEVVTRLEQAAEIFRVLVTEGPAGLWRMLLEKLGDIKETILGQIREFVITRIIKAGIMWLIGLLNPASAFVKACMMIYDIVSFFIERGQQIIEFVNSIINSLGAIVAGNIAGMANAIERTLARILPIAISFLAALLGLGGISAKIRQIIETIQRPVNRAIDWVIGKAVQLVRRAGRLFSRGGSDEQEGSEAADPEVQAQIDVGLETLRKRDEAAQENGALSREEAENVASAVRSEHPVFRSVNVIPEGNQWAYEWRANPGGKVGGGDQEEATAPPEGVKVENGDVWRIKNPIPVTFNRKQHYEEKEYRDQLKHQQRGLNALEVARWEQNRRDYSIRRADTGSGRHPDSAREQRIFRATRRQELILERRESGMSKEEAEQSVDAFMRTQAALHDPDQIAGGEATGIRRLGHRGINSSIGSQWRNKVDDLDNRVAALNLEQNEKERVMMNVELRMRTV